VPEPLPPAPPPPSPAATPPEAPSAEPRVPIVTRDGQYGTVPQSGLPDALKSGAQVATTHQKETADAEAEARDALGAAAPLAAGGAGLARGLTLGLSDYGIAKGAEAFGVEKGKTGRVLRGLEQAHPLLSTGTELVGNIAPMLASGGTAGAAEAGVAGAGAVAERGLGAIAGSALRVAGAPVRAASGLGELAGRGLERVITGGVEQGVLGRLGTGLAKAGISGAAEGAVYGAGSALSESVLEDKDLTAEELLASMGGAGLVGGALGSLSSAPFLGAGEVIRGAKSAASGLSRIAEGAVPALREAGEGLFQRGSALAKEGVEFAKNAVDINDPKSLLSRADAAVSEHLDPAKIMAMSDEQAARSTYARKKFVDEANARLKPGPNGEPAGWEGVGRVLKDTGVIDVKAGVLDNAMPLEQVGEKIGNVLEQKGQAIGALTRDSAASIKVGSIAEALEKEIANVRGKAGFENILGSLETYRESLYRELGARKILPDGMPGPLLIGKEVPIQELVRQRQALQDLVFRESKSLDPNMRVGHLRDIRGGLKDLEREALIKEGRVDAKAYDSLNRDYQALRIAQDATDDAISRGGANRSIGATDYLAFVGGMAGGGAIGGAGLAMANKLARERGSGAAAVFLHNLAESRSLVQAAKKAGMDVGEAAGKALPGVKALAERAQPFAEGAITQVQDAVTALRRSEVIGEVAQRSQEMKASIGRVATQLATATGTGLKMASDTRRVGLLRGYLTYEAYEKRRKELEAMKDSPGLVTQSLEKHFGGVMAAAPELGFAIANRAHAVVDYMASKLPPADVDPYSLTPLARAARPRELSAGQVRFMRAMAVADDPRVAMAHLEQGTLSLDEADALRVAWPNIFAATRQSILTAFSRRDPKLGPAPYQQQVQLAILFDAPTSRTLTGSFIHAMQATNDPLPQDQPQQGGPPGGAPPPQGQKLSAKPLNLPNMGAPSEMIEQREMRSA
jgi:hypothetical protein